MMVRVNMSYDIYIFLLLRYYTASPSMRFEIVIEILLCRAVVVVACKCKPEDARFCEINFFPQEYAGKYIRINMFPDVLTLASFVWKKFLQNRGEISFDT